MKDFQKHRWNGWEALRLTGSLLPIVLSLSCQSSLPMPAVDLSEPGWTVVQGQAVWRSKHDAPEIAGELLLATNAGGRTFVEFTKTPLPILVAQTTSNSWRIDLIAENRTFSGHSTPPTRVLWLHLAAGLNGTPLPSAVSFLRTDSSHWRIENTRSGETIQGYLLPVP